VNENLLGLLRFILWSVMSLTHGFYTLASYLNEYSYSIELFLLCNYVVITHTLLPPVLITSHLNVILLHSCAFLPSCPISLYISSYIFLFVAVALILVSWCPLNTHFCPEFCPPMSLFLHMSECGSKIKLKIKNTKMWNLHTTVVQTELKQN
jgi:hypothetical protein